MNSRKEEVKVENITMCFINILLNFMPLKIKTINNKFIKFVRITVDPVRSGEITPNIGSYDNPMDK